MSSPFRLVYSGVRLSFVTAAVLMGMGSNAATAAGTVPPPSLVGEELRTFTVTAASLDCTPIAATMTWHATGVAVGPYPGTFSEEGTTSFNPSNGTITDLNVSFTIDSVVGTVTGTKTIGALPLAGFCEQQFNMGDINTGFADYDATITTSGGRFKEAGRSELSVAVNCGPSGCTRTSSMDEIFHTSNGLLLQCTNDPTDIDPRNPVQPGWGVGDVNHCHIGPPGLTP